MDGLCQDLFTVLASAISEWCLMILLFINALLGHVAAKLANSCKLPAPCALCSRLDLILRRGFRFDSLCRAHKLEISTMVFCPDHRRLANVREMCAACLASLAKKKNSNLDAYKLFVGMTGLELGDESVEAPFLSMDVNSDSSGAGRCSCCSRRIRRKNHPHVPMKAKETGGNVANLAAPGDGMSKKNKKSIGSTTSGCPLPQVGYQKLNITSDSDMEVPLSDDDDDGTSRTGLIGDRREESKSVPRQPLKLHKVEKVPTVVIAEYTVPEKLIHPTSVDPERYLLDTQSDITSEETSEKSYMVSGDAIGHGLNWNQLGVKNNPVSGYVSKESSTSKSIASDMNYALTSSDIEVTKELSSTNMPSYIMNDPRISAQANDRNDSFKLSLCHKGSIVSPRFSEIVAAKEPSRLQESLMMKLASISSSRGIELPWNDPTSSPKGLGDEAKSLDPFTPVGSRHFSKRFSIERNSSSIESLEGGMTVEHLKRQLESERKAMNDLYKELEEERNASAIAASEAMAMINRLQEEKASMQMEALQYLRVMEEQAEYDQEALQKLSDLLTDREKELLDLEAELESYRQHYGEDFAEEKVIEPLGQQTKPGTGAAQNPLFGFEEEKGDILKCLRKLQEELRAHSIHNAYENGVNDRQKDDIEKPCSVNVNGQDNHSGVEHESRLRSDSVGDKKIPSLNRGEVNSLQAELQNLSTRMEALEEDRKFLELSTKISINGNEGLQFVQEIACQLHELRRIQGAQRG